MEPTIAAEPFETSVPVETIVQVTGLSKWSICELLKNGELQAENWAPRYCVRPRWLIPTSSLDEFRRRRSNSQLGKDSEP